MLILITTLLNTFIVKQINYNHFYLNCSVILSTQLQFSSLEFINHTILIVMIME